MFLTPNRNHDLDPESRGHRSFGLLRSAVENAIAGETLEANKPVELRIQRRR